MELDKNVYAAAELEVVCAFGADIVTASSGIIESGSDPDKDAGFGHVPGGDDSWDA